MQGEKVTNFEDKAHHLPEPKGKGFAQHNIIEVLFPVENENLRLISREYGESRVDFNAVFLIPFPRVNDLRSV